MKIACVGGGPASLYFAILMKQQDPSHEITVHERNPPGSTYGWGVTYWGDLFDTLYGNDPEDGVGGTGAFFLLLDEPEVYGFPPDPVVTTKDLPEMYTKAAAAAGTLLAGAVIAFLGRRP